MMNKKILDDHEELLARIEKLELVRYDLTNPIASKKEDCIDLHGGHSKYDGITMFRKELKRIEQGLLNGSIIPNSGIEKFHVVSVECGYGNHSPNPDGNGTLKSFMMVYFTSSKLDFAYIEKHGSFLIKIDVSNIVNH